jgi:hypothetical protein
MAGKRIATPKEHFSQGQEKGKERLECNTLFMILIFLKYYYLYKIIHISARGLL